MVSRAADLLEQLFALPESERNDFLAGLAERLPDGDGDQPFQSTDWQVEIARRIDDITSHTDTFEDWETAASRCAWLDGRRSPSQCPPRPTPGDG